MWNLLFGSGAGVCGQQISETRTHMYARVHCTHKLSSCSYFGRLVVLGRAVAHMS